MYDSLCHVSRKKLARFLTIFSHHSRLSRLAQRFFRQNGLKLPSLTLVFCLFSGKIAPGRSSWFAAGNSRVAQQEIKNIFLLGQRMQQRGISEYTLNLAKELMRRGYAVSVACGPGPLAHQFAEANINITQYDHIERRFRSPFLVGRLLNQLREFRPDILHVQSSDMGSLGAEMSRAQG